MLVEWDMFLQVVFKLSQPYMFALHADHSNLDMATFVRVKTVYSQLSCVTKRHKVPVVIHHSGS